ncbi:MAG TPA: peptidylprolyl isomerase [Dehalococcoidia bacterium]|nr:peptidylprolyl isomerase [Dehalococcoidia bacterium]
MEGGLPVLSRLGKPFTRIFGDAAAVDPDRRNAVFLIGGIGAVVVAALALIAYGYYTDRIEPRRENVLRVGDRHFNYAYIERRLKSDVSRGLFDVRDFQNSVPQSIARIQREELIRIIARERGITVSSEELDAKLRDELGLGDEVSHDQMASVLRTEVLSVNLPLDDYLEMMEAEVLQDKIEASFTDSLPAQTEQVNLNIITAGSQSNAILAKQALDAGGAFADVAKQYSQDDEAQAGGAFGWVPRELLEPEVADVAFSTTGVSGIIESETNYYIIEALEKQPRDVTPEIKEEIGQKEFRKLLESAFNNTILVYDLSQEQLTRLANELSALTSG